MIALTLLILSHIFFRGRKATDPIQSQIDAAWQYILDHGMNQQICILVDYSLPSGCNRLWVWDFNQQQKIFECPVAHGRGKGKKCKGSRRDTACFSNEPETWLSSLGHARIAERYIGRNGISYRLDGLDLTNSNIRDRAIVLHGHKSVPEKPIFPLPSHRSHGCVMVADKNMAHLDALLQSQQDVLLYCYA
ncbi:MAG: murein L,D-transpeptidase catalytic domain family protein [Bacteroidales bacterium]|nr:murein L,D-transpeptidase catalytic domain family protein [Bacteroidales bacterium]